MSKSRNWCFTLNNYTEREVEVLKNTISTEKYAVWGYEVGENGTPHLQGYIQFNNPRIMPKSVQARAHWEPRMGNHLQAATYCKKDGNFWESKPFVDDNQGRRTDLITIKDAIVAGKKVDTICLEDPMLYHQYGRTLNKIEDLAMRRRFRTEMTRGIWYWGNTGVGKSHIALDGFTPETHYIVPNDHGWWDGYTQQDTVILNDFRGEIPYNEMLQLVDKWPYSVRRRNREPLPFTSRTVIVTSSLPPWDVYVKREAEDNIQQLLRRFEVIRMFGNGTRSGGGGNTDPPHLTLAVVTNNNTETNDDITARLTRDIRGY